MSGKYLAYILLIFGCWNIVFGIVITYFQAYELDSFYDYYEVKGVIGFFNTADLPDPILYEQKFKINGYFFEILPLDVYKGLFPIGILLGVSHTGSGILTLLGIRNKCKIYFSTGLVLSSFLPYFMVFLYLWIFQIIFTLLAWRLLKKDWYWSD